jgi:pyruvate kinase
MGNDKIKPTEKIFVTIRNTNNKALVRDFKIYLDNVIKFRYRGIRINLKNFDDLKNQQIIINEILPFKNESIQIMLDLPYPYSKVRGKLNNQSMLTLVKDESVYIRHKCLQSDSEKTIYVNKIGFKEIKKSEDIIYFGDGSGGFEIIESNEDVILVRSIRDQIFYTTHSFITKDNLRENENVAFFDILNKTKYPPDYTALSFVQCKEDILKFKQKLNFETKIISKIETSAALDNIQEIISVSDAIMVARGDLAFSIHPSKFYSVQEKLITICQETNTELIIATDILSSLDKRSFPSRADIIDFQHIINRVEGLVISGSVSYEQLENTTRIVNMITD